MKVCDSGSQSGRVMLRWRKAELDSAAHSFIPRSLFIDAQRGKKNLCRVTVQNNRKEDGIWLISRYDELLNWMSYFVESPDMSLLSSEAL